MGRRENGGPLPRRGLYLNDTEGHPGAGYTVTNHMGTTSYYEK